MPLTPGDRLGPYEIVSRIGKGGMGEVWKARDSRLGRDVAIKVSIQQFTDRFGREARAIAALNHPHICTLYDVGPNYLVMEYVEGAELKGPLPVAKAIELAGQILDAMDAAHRKGITHRDLKPANILVSSSGVKVLDFGLAKIGHAQGMPGDETLTVVTVEGTIAGTLYYMAPEQLQGKEVDSRADIFSFGCVLYEMLMGKRAFDGSNGASVIAAVMERSAPSVAEIAPPALDRILRRCLEKDRDQRFQNARDLKWDLMRAIEPAAEFPKTLGWSGRAGWMLAAVAVIAAAILAFVHFRERPAEAPIARFTITPPEKTLPDFSAGIAISPDSRRLVFQATSPDKSVTQLWLRSLDSLDSRPLAGTEHGLQPFWSPTGESIGFFAGGKLKRIDLAGGSAVTLTEAPDPRGGTWNSEGEIVFSPDETEPLMMISAAGGAPRAISRLDKENEPHQVWPWFLPDGRHFLFAGWKSADGMTVHTTIHIGSVESREVRTIGTADSIAKFAPDPHPGRSGQGYLIFRRGNALMAQPFDAQRLVAGPGARELTQLTDGSFSASTDGTLIYSSGTAPLRQFIWFDRAGHRDGVLGEPSGFDNDRYDGSFSPDGKKIALSVMNSTSRTRNIWIYDATTGLPTRFTFEPDYEFWPRWSTDGESIVFSSSRKKSMDLYRKAASGAGIEQLLLEDDTDKYGESWSPDGKFMLYSRDGVPNTGTDLWVLPDPAGPGGAAKPYPFLATKFKEFSGQFSPDGKWVAYLSDESGRLEVYATQFPMPGGTRQITTVGAGSFHWRRDGKEIFFDTYDNRVMAVDVIAKGPNLELGATRTLFGPVSGLYGFDVTGDGQRFLLNVVQEHTGSESLTLVQNWMSGLKK